MVPFHWMWDTVIIDKMYIHNMYYSCCDEKRYVYKYIIILYVCILNIRPGPEIAVCHLPLSTYMYNTTKVTSLFDVCMLDVFGT